MKKRAKIGVPIGDKKVGSYQGVRPEVQTIIEETAMTDKLQKSVDYANEFVLRNFKLYLVIEEEP
jgi:hypothetical protein